MSQKKDSIDSFFDSMDRIVDGAATVLKDMPEPEGDEELPQYKGQTPKVIDMPQPLLKSGEKRGPREVTLKIKAIAEKFGGVKILTETATHEIVVINLSKEDWKVLCDNADWMRMVKE